uniref:FHA domain-containing protein n=1 Tax=Anopheles epiroticus TaxID=199890 RepID=A0A182PE38_9DIPT
MSNLLDPARIYFQYCYLHSGMISKEFVYYLVSNTPCHTVGRAGTDLMITGDDSISRNHAMLQPHKDVLKLTDTASRYGSYVNDNINRTVPISKEHPTELKPGDLIRFGRCDSIWTVGKATFRCLTSTLVMDDQLKVTLKKLGAELVPIYTPGLTHLIMPTITVTTKLLHCLVGQVPIVKPDYFHTIERECIGKGKALPSTKDFIPTCSETYIRSEQRNFQPNASRSKLFRGKEFIFLNTAQYNQYENIVKLAGGVCLDAQRDRIAKSRFLNPNVITVKLNLSDSSQSQSQLFDKLSQYIASRGRRIIPDPEIGLAIIHCSTEKYCNPDYSFAFNVEECYSSASTGGETLAKNTEQQTEHLEQDVKRSNGVEINTIPETEPLTEQKAGAVTENKPPPNRNNRNVSMGSTASFLVPNALPITTVPEERRKSKRMQEVEQNRSETNDVDEACRNTVTKRSRRDKSPPKSVCRTSQIDSKLSTEPERNESEINVPETQPTPNPVPSQALQARGFIVVNRDSTEPDTRAPGKDTSKRRAANLHHKLDDEVMFDFDEIIPRKKGRVDKGSEKPTTSVTVTRNRRNVPAEQEDPFCFEEIPTKQQRRVAAAANQHRKDNDTQLNAKAQPSSTPSNASSSRLTVGIQNKSNSGNDSTIGWYKEFIKPIQPSSLGWLSSTMCGLKLTEHCGEQTFDSVKIKSEPLDEIDDPYGLQKDCKKWNKSMENAFAVREVNIKLVSHRPIDVSGQEVSCVALDGGKNFKAFIKKRNYPVQQLVMPTKSVCVRDENQCA